MPTASLASSSAAADPFTLSVPMPCSTAELADALGIPPRTHLQGDTAIPEVTETTPFVGAETCYGRAYKLLKWMGEEGGYVKQIKDSKGKTIRCEVNDDMTRLIEALNQGDEETIKGYLVNPRYFDIIHAN